MLCERLAEEAHKKNPQKFPTVDAARSAFKDKLNEYAAEGNKLWYDYYHLAKDVLDLDPKIVDKLHEEIYRQYGGLNLAEGIDIILRKLIKSGYKIYVITNAVRGVIEKRLELVGLKDLLSSDKFKVITGDDVEEVITKREHIELALEDANVEPHEVLFIVKRTIDTILPSLDLIKGAKVMCYKHPEPSKVDPYGSPGLRPQMVEIITTIDRELVQYGTLSLQKALINLLE